MRRSRETTKPRTPPYCRSNCSGGFRGLGTARLPGSCQHRSTQRRQPIVLDDEDALTQAIIRLASEYGSYGYRRVGALLRAEGWHVNLKRVWRIWRREGLRVPIKHPRRSRLTPPVFLSCATRAGGGNPTGFLSLMSLRRVFIRTVQNKATLIYGRHDFETR